MHKNLNAISKNLVTGAAITIGALLTEKAVSNTKKFLRKRRNDKVLMELAIQTKVRNAVLERVMEIDSPLTTAELVETIANEEAVSMGEVAVAISYFVNKRFFVITEGKVMMKPYLSKNQE